LAVTTEIATTIEPYYSNYWKYETLTTVWNRKQLHNSNLLWRN